MKPGSERIAEERQRQIDAERWSPSHDDSFREGQLAQFAALYAVPPEKRGDRIFGMLYPSGWLRNYWKPCPDDRIRELEKAGALIAAEIDRLARVCERESAA